MNDVSKKMARFATDHWSLYVQPLRVKLKNGQLAFITQIFYPDLLIPEMIFFGYSEGRSQTWNKDGKCRESFSDSGLDIVKVSLEDWIKRHG